MAYQFTFPRIVLAVFCGAFVGASLSTLQIAIMSSISNILLFSYVFFGSYFLWLLGIVILGLPVWLFLHWKEKRSILTSIPIGFFCSTLFWFYFISTRFEGIRQGSYGSLSGWGMQKSFDEILSLMFAELSSSIQVGIIGIPVALSMWFLAYRPE